MGPGAVFPHSGDVPVLLHRHAGACVTARGVARCAFSAPGVDRGSGDHDGGDWDSGSPVFDGGGELRCSRPDSEISNAVPVRVPAGRTLGTVPILAVPPNRPG